jgi:hypothetical protein
MYQFVDLDRMAISSMHTHTHWSSPTVLRKAYVFYVSVATLIIVTPYTVSTPTDYPAIFVLRCRNNEC